jgi:protein phosphatase
MSIFSGLYALLGTLSRVLAAPFLAVGRLFSSIQMLNPLPIFSNLWRTLSGSVTGAARTIGLGNLKLGGLGRFLDVAGWREALFARDGAQRRRRRVGQIAQFSQIHLVGAGDRHIVHIGTSVGRANADLALKANGETVILSFDRRDLPSTVDGVMVRADHPSALHNGTPLKGEVLVRSGDVLTLNGQAFSFQIFAWQRVPLITRVSASYATHTGPHRTSNEDALAIYQHPKAYLFAVADGVGGGAEGDQASAYAAQYLLSAFHKNARFTLPWPEVLRVAFRHINAEVRAFSRRTPMPVGTTLTAVVVKDFQAYVAHVGDSRALLWREGTLRQLTTDHVQRQPAELPTRVAFELQEPHPLRDVLTRAIGKQDTLEPELLSVALRPDDRLVLLSDGVYDALAPAELTHTLREFSTSHVADALVSRAVHAGAKDNVSALAFEVLPDPFVEDTWTAESAPRIFTGYRRGWPVKLRRVTDPVTAHPTSGGLVLLFLIALAGLVWLVLRALGGAG